MRKPSVLNDLQVATISQEARARAAQSATYVVTLVPLQIAAWGDIIDTIKHEGWKLEQFALSPAGHAVAVFDRVSRITVTMERPGA